MLLGFGLKAFEFLFGDGYVLIFSVLEAAHETLARGAELIGEMQYEDTYRLAYIRGPEGIIVALAEQLG